MAAPEPKAGASTLDTIVEAYHQKPRTGGRPADAVTLVVNDQGRLNKRFTRLTKDAVTKDGATKLVEGHAIVVPVPDEAALAKLLWLVGQHVDAALILGYPADAPKGAFRVLSLARMAQSLGLDADADEDKLTGWHTVDGQPAICRLKANMRPSSWILFDRDVPPGAPPEWASWTIDEWIAQVAAVIPGFAAAGKIILPSTSSRVLVDDVPFASASTHIFVQVEDPADVQRFARDAFMRALDAGLVCMRPNRASADRGDGVKAGDIIGHTPTTIWDRAAVGAERLVYDGCPATSGPGLTVARTKLYTDGDGDGIRLDTALTLPVELESVERIRTQRGIAHEAVKRRDGGADFILTDTLLRLATKIVTKTGAVAVADLWLTRGGGRVRCQAPFRDSASWAAFVGWHADGTPFVFDSGSQTRHRLHPDDAKGPPPDAFWKAAEAAGAAPVAAGSDEKVKTAFAAWCRAAGRHGLAKEDVALRAEQAASLLKPHVGKATIAVLRAMMRKIAADEFKARTEQARSELDEHFDRINERHFVLALGADIVVAEFGRSHGRELLVARKKGAFFDMLAPVQVQIGKMWLQVAPLWFRSPKRRQYLEGTDMIANGPTPAGVLNLWRGWPVDTDRTGIAGCRRTLRHLREVICGGNRAEFRYLLRLLARWVQEPGLPGMVSVVLLGEPGTGKGVFGRLMVDIFGAHGLHLLDVESFLGRFTGHLATAAFAFLDEALFSGDPRQAQALKGRITEPVIKIEMKGKDAVWMPNRTKVIIATNDQSAVQIEQQDRRAFVPSFSNARRGDKAYFDALRAEAESADGKAAFLSFLLRLDIGAFDATSERPDTAGLAEQKALTSTDVDAWLLDVLDSGLIGERPTRDDASGWRPMRAVPDEPAQASLWRSAQPAGNGPRAAAGSGPRGAGGEAGDQAPPWDAWEAHRVEGAKLDVFEHYRRWHAQAANRRRTARPQPYEWFFRRIKDALGDAVMLRDVGTDDRGRLVRFATLDRCRAAWATRRGGRREWLG
ncbi:primase-helicase family protein [Amaricoccus sp.]|uniref:primase-helicase family protein n=1 Tax=Amaricoccus sp. TaxID=1872485 RepID=UPI001B51F9A6|nr:primase-helicase family protein [Amaricoccus sp.]MBP7002287.1 hypothetical protein [Amaricoccus sp.]